MLALARERCVREGWRNVTLIESAMETADIPAPVDAILFNFTHDVLRSPAGPGAHLRGRPARARASPWPG